MELLRVCPCSFAETGTHRLPRKLIVHPEPEHESSPPTLCLIRHETLGNLARRLAVQGKIEQQDALIDSRIQWSEYKNLWYNAAVRSSLSMPFYLLRKMFKP